MMSMSMCVRRSFDRSAPATAASAAHTQVRLAYTVVAIASVDELGSVCIAIGIAAGGVLVAVRPLSGRTAVPTCHG